MSITIISCSKGYDGTYISEKDSKSYMELKSDDTFLIQEGKMGVSGKYEIEDKTITLIFDMGISQRGKIEKGIIIDPDGEKWIKK